MKKRKQAHKEAIQARRERERSQRIQSILQAAKAVFFSKGYLKATMDDVALQAQLSKPTIYQYFKTKDDLFSSLQFPVVEDTGRQMEDVEKKLEAGMYTSGRELLKEVFDGFMHSYEMDPDAFRVSQLFQQTGLVWELGDANRQLTIKLGKNNFIAIRRVLEKAMALGFVKPRNVYQVTDMLWGGFLGIVQISDVKSQNKPGRDLLRGTLELFMNTVADALVKERIA